MKAWVALGSGHTESGLPRRAAVCARGGNAFEVYYVRLHHLRQTEGELMRRSWARLLLDGDDAVLRNTFRWPSHRGHRSLPAAAARLLCGQTLSLDQSEVNWWAPVNTIISSGVIHLVGNLLDHYIMFWKRNQFSYLLKFLISQNHSIAEKR